CNTLFPGSAVTPRPPAATSTRAGPSPSLAAPTENASQTPSAPRVTSGPAATLTAEFTLTALPATDTATAPAKSQPNITPAPIRPCDFVRGESVAAQMRASVLTAGTPTPEPPPALPTNTPVDAATTTRHLQVFNELISAIQTDYVYTNVVKNQLPTLQKQ